MNDTTRNVKGFMTPFSMAFLLLLSFILTAHLWNISLLKTRLNKNQKIVHLRNRINQTLPEILRKIENQGNVALPKEYVIENNHWSLNFQKRYWGLFERLKIVAKKQGFSAKEDLIIGKRADLKTSNNFFFNDHDFSLFLSGEASIVGRGFYPKKGIKKSTAIYDERNNVKVELDDIWIPKLPFKKAQARIVSSISSILESLENDPVEEIVRFDVLRLDEFSDVENKIFLCDEAWIKSGFKGRVQVFARSSIQIDERVILDYPSAMVLINQNGSMRLREGSKITGSLVCIGEDSSLLIERGSKVVGEVFSLGTLDLKGLVEGFLMANHTIHNLPSGKRRSFIVDGKVRPFEKLPYQVFSSINPFLKSYAIASY